MAHLTAVPDAASANLSADARHPGGPRSPDLDVTGDRREAAAQVLLAAARGPPSAISFSARRSGRENTGRSTPSVT